MEVRTSDTGTVVVPDSETSPNITTNGTLIIEIAANMDMDGGMYVYDVEVTDSNNKVSTWLHGLFIVNEDVTE